MSLKNFNELKHRVKLLKSTETVDDEANHIKTYSEVAEVWANIEIKPRYVTRDTATEQILMCTVTIRKRDINFDAVEIDGKRMVLKVPPYSDSVYTYLQGEVTA